MAPQLLAAVLRPKQFLRCLLDLVWPTLDSPSRSLLGADEPRLEIKADAHDDVLREVYGRLSAELEVEAERRRAVETKLLAVGSVAPIAVTIIVAAVSFLSSGRLQDFVPASVVVILAMAVYVALQFLRAMLAAISGLSRKAYTGPTISEIVRAGTEGWSGYLRNASHDVARRIVQHREMTNDKVSQLALAHRAIKNAVVALVFDLLILAGLIWWESLS